MVIIAANINMDNCEFRHNFGGLSGAISWQGGGAVNITNTLFYANNATWVLDDEGGGMWGIPDGYGAANKGGAIGISLSNGKNNKLHVKIVVWSIMELIIRGAIYFEETGAANNGAETPITFENCVIADNFAMSSWNGNGNADGGKGGGAIYMHNAVPNMQGFL